MYAVLISLENILKWYISSNLQTNDSVLWNQNHVRWQGQPNEGHN